MNLAEYLNSKSEEDLAEIAELFISSGKFASKDFINSLSKKVFIDIPSLKYEIEYFAISYEKYIRSGRRAGSKYPPKIPIQNWMKFKGIPLQFTVPIQRAIATQGIKSFDFIDYYFTDQKISDLSKGISELLQKDLTQTIKTSIE